MCLRGIGFFTMHEAGMKLCFESPTKYSISPSIKQYQICKLYMLCDQIGQYIMWIGQEQSSHIEWNLAGVRWGNDRSQMGHNTSQMGHDMSQMGNGSSQIGHWQKSRGAWQELVGAWYDSGGTWQESDGAWHDSDGAC